jgi:hypothetical protein
MKKLTVLFVLALVAIAVLAVAIGVTHVSKDGKMTIAAGSGSSNADDEVTRATREALDGNADDEVTRATREALDGNADDEVTRATREALGESPQHSPINPVIVLIGASIAAIAVHNRRKS